MLDHDIDEGSFHVEKLQHREQLLPSLCGLT